MKPVTLCLQKTWQSLDDNPGVMSEFPDVISYGTNQNEETDAAAPYIKACCIKINWTEPHSRDRERYAIMFRVVETFSSNRTILCKMSQFSLMFAWT